jgi:ribosome-associated protein
VPSKVDFATIARVNEILPPSDSAPAIPGESQRVELAPNIFVPTDAVRIQYARSSGPGGQNVNKVNTRAEIWVAVNAIIGLSPGAMDRLRRLAGKRLTREDTIHIIAQTERSQERNRQSVFDRLREMIEQARIEPKIRRPTKPSRAAKKKRLDAKRRRGEVKARRSGIGEE